MSIEHFASKQSKEPTLFTEKDVPFYPTEEYGRFTVKFFETEKGMTVRMEPKQQYADMYTRMSPPLELSALQEQLKKMTFKDYNEANVALSKLLHDEFARQENLQRNQVDIQVKSYSIENENR